MKAREERCISFPSTKGLVVHRSLRLKQRSNGQMTLNPLLAGSLPGMKLYIQTSPGRDKGWPVCLCFSRENSMAINPVTPVIVTPDAGIAGSC